MFLSMSFIMMVFGESASRGHEEIFYFLQFHEWPLGKTSSMAWLLQEQCVFLLVCEYFEQLEFKQYTSNSHSNSNVSEICLSFHLWTLPPDFTGL